MIDAKQVAARLNTSLSTSDVSHVTMPTMGMFASHFASIACPPSCEWFDESYGDLVRSVVDLSLRDVTSVQCDWDEHGPDMRAFVQRMVAEQDRHEGNMDEVTCNL